VALEGLLLFLGSLPAAGQMQQCTVTGPVGESRALFSQVPTKLLHVCFNLFFGFSGRLFVSHFYLLHISFFFPIIHHGFNSML
jgi:hypothetical protein